VNATTLDHPTQVHLPFGKEGLCVTLPTGFDYHVLEAKSIPALPDPVAEIEQAIQKANLSQLAQGKKTAAISICDITRPAPNPTVLPPLLRALESAGIPREGIRILIATGLHRAATEAEIRQIAGPETAAHYTILNHDARNLDQHRRLGTTKSGTPVFVDERFLSADLHLSLGFIEPHLMLGFSGGRKLIAPGLAGEPTIKELHSSRFMRDPRAREGSVWDNPLHAELLEIARMARHDFIIDVSLNRARKIAQVFAGEPEATHAAGMRWVSSMHMQDVGAPADAVITTSAGYPLDLTFYQCVKGITAAANLVRKGGSMLLFGKCDEGVGGKEFAQMLARYNSGAAFLKGIENVPVTIDQWQLEKLALAATDREVLFCVPGLQPEYHSGLWGKSYNAPSEAIEALFTTLKPGAKVTIIPEGPYVLAKTS
jgi:nickel-dependent lactate racemase